MKKENYEYFDVNLTPYSGYTYLGYQVGSENNALRDIRISNSTASSIVFGDASYGKMGSDGKATTPDGLSLFATYSASAGSPIISISIENKRLELGSGKEPVCLFSGGNAVDIGQKWKDNILECGEDSNVEYFLDKGGWTTYKNSKKAYSYEFISQDDPDNGLYLYFQPKKQFKSKDENGNAAQRYIAGFSYFLAGDKETDKNNNKYGSNYEFMQKFAKSNGFELLQKDGEAFCVMSDTAGEMTLATTWRDVGGYPADTYNFDQVHTIYGTVVTSKHSIRRIRVQNTCIFYLGVGNTKEEAFVDMIGTTNAYAAVDVNYNYNSFSKKWIAVGYRRTNDKANAITDIFLYSGENPPAQVRIDGGYSGITKVQKGQKVLTFSKYTDSEKIEGVEYKVLKHNLKSGYEIVSLNEGNGGTGLYLYYTRANFYTDKSAESAVSPITNICFTYGDISTRYATTGQLASVFERSYYGSMKFDSSAYTNPIWECVVGIDSSPENWKLTAESGTQYSLNKGVIPGIGGNGWESSDNRVYMYVDRADSNAKIKYQVRESCKLPDFGYYSPTAAFGYIKQVS